IIGLNLCHLLDDIDASVSQIVDKFFRPRDLFGVVADVTSWHSPIAPVAFDLCQLHFVCAAQVRRRFFTLQPRGRAKSDALRLVKIRQSDFVAALIAELERLALAHTFDDSGALLLMSVSADDRRE